MMPTDISFRLARSTRRLWPILPVQTSRRRGFCTSLSGSTFWKLSRAKSESGDMASGWRSIDFGVKTISGLRHLRIAWRRSRWKYCAAVDGCAIWMLSCAASWR